MKKSAPFRIPVSMLAEFKAACRRRGLTQETAGTQALAEWLNPSKPEPEVRYIYSDEDRSWVAAGFAVVAIVSFLTGLLF